MPLSEEEMRLLEQMERALSEEDPKFASTLRGTTVNKATRGRLILAIGAFVVGIVVLMTGAIMSLTWLGIVGFVIMLGSATLGLTAWKGRSAESGGESAEQGWPGGERPTGQDPRFSVIEGGKKQRRPKQPKSQGGFMQRMEERWEKRRRDRGQF